MTLQNQNNIRKIYDFLVMSGCTPQGAVGMTANIYAESRCDPLCIEALLIKRYEQEGFLKWDYGLYDENTYRQYWSYYDSGAISEAEFISPRQYTGVKHQYGAGLCQWTAHDRKRKWLSLAKDDGKPLTDLGVQLNFLYYELHETFPDVWRVIHASINTEICTNYVLENFERPADVHGQKPVRQKYAQEIEKFIRSTNMKVIIGSARIDENGHAHDGKPGDQTGREVSTQAYYRHAGDWYALRFKNPVHAKRAAQAMKSACSNSNWGYNQYQRTSGMKLVAKYGYDTAKLNTPAATDCSNLVRVCFIYATGKDPGDFDTSAEKGVLLSTGLVVEVQFNEVTGAGLCEGDILVTKKKGHTVIVTEGGARQATTDKPKVNTVKNYKIELPAIKIGDKNNAVLLFQETFNARNAAWGWKQKNLSLDGDFGAATKAAVIWYQKQRKLDADGVCGHDTWKDLIALPEVG